MWHKLDMRVSLTVLIVLLNIYLVRSGPSFHPESALDGVDVWTNANAKWFIYPELSSSSNYFLPVIDVRQNFGVAVSGGGCGNTANNWCNFLSRRLHLCFQP